MKLKKNTIIIVNNSHIYSENILAVTKLDSIARFVTS